MEAFQVCIRLPTSSQLHLSVLPSTTIGEIKVKIGQEVGTIGRRIRIIYLGRVLKDWERVGTVGIGLNCVLQAYLRPEEGNQSVTKRHIHKSPVSNAIRMECAFQNVHTLDTILTLCAEEDFDINKRRWRVGQWVDVQDAARQWLEGQVREVREGEVLIHYLGWPQSWDEWLPAASHRLQFFRFKTSQSLYAPTHSPYPTMTIDAFSWMRSDLLDYSDLLLESIDLLTRVRPLLDSYFPMYSPEVLTSPEVLESSEEGSWQGRLTPMSEREREVVDRRGQWVGVALDRVGRLVSDLGLIASSPCSSLGSMPAPRELLRRYN